MHTSRGREFHSTTTSYVARGQVEIISTFRLLYINEQWRVGVVWEDAGGVDVKKATSVVSSMVGGFNFSPEILCLTLIPTKENFFPHFDF